MQTTSQAPNLMQQAVAALQQGRPADARQAVSAAIQQGMNNASSWGVLALACRDQGDMDAAQEAADRSIAFEPKNPRVLVVKGDAFYATGKRQAAAAYYRDALKFAGTAENIPAEIQTELRRAQTRVADLQRDFERHLEEHVGSQLKSPSVDTARMRNALDLMCGRRKVFYPEPHHFMFPGLPIREFYDPGEFDWVSDLEAATADIRGELEGLLEQRADFNPYLTDVQDRPAYDTHGMKDNGDWGAFYLWNNGVPVPENQARCPRTTAALRQVPLVSSGQRCPNVLFSRLKAGARIPPHTGMVNTRLICHLALIVPDGCGFRVGNDTRKWEEGKVWLFDDTIEHEAWNQSTFDRVVLIFEVWRPELSEPEQEFVTSVLKAVDSY